MTQFAVGDRVRDINDQSMHYGHEGVVTNIDPEVNRAFAGEYGQYVTVRFDDPAQSAELEMLFGETVKYPSTWNIHEGQLEPAAEPREEEAK